MATENFLQKEKSYSAAKKVAIVEKSATQKNNTDNSTSNKNMEESIENEVVSIPQKTSGGTLDATEISLKKAVNTKTATKNISMGDKKPSSKTKKSDATIKAKLTGVEKKSKANISDSVSPIKKINTTSKAKSTKTVLVSKSTKATEIAVNPITKEKKIAKTIELIQSLQPASLKRISFQVKYYTSPGQSLFVTGNHALLGNNDVEHAFALSYLNDDFWYGTLEIPEGEKVAETITYNYLFKNSDGTTTIDWGTEKLIQPATYSSAEVLFIDTWNASSLIENTFYTEPFQAVLLKENFTPVKPKQTKKVTHIFRVKAPLIAKGQALCLVGSSDEIGNWTTDKPLLLSRNENETYHAVSLNLSKSTFPISYKYGLYDVNENQFIEFESGSNRVVYDGDIEDKLTVISDGFANISYKAFKGAGIAIPVFSLRTQNSFGVGEFADLKLLVDWAKKVGLKLIQLLPLNDTTATHTYTDSYPYAAISAFALHPLFLHLPSMVSPQNQSLLTALQDVQKELNDKPAVDYTAVMSAKLKVIKDIFASQKEATFSENSFTTFFNENAHWLIPYAAFCHFREINHTPDFNQWKDNNVYDAEAINAIASSPMKADENISIHFFIQYHLHLQLLDATKYAHDNGIIVKGDIPIGIYRNSSDAWQEPALYNMNMQAGAPPDDFAIKGQNWGFPTYNWQKMMEDGFSWWKRRFKQMSYYFDAFRIDHILGFFRIWSIPLDAVEGIMGHFVPAVPLYINELENRGIQFNHARLCSPFITNDVLAEFFGEDNELVKAEFLQDAGYGYYSLKEAFNTQRKVDNYFAAKDANEHNDKLKFGLFNLISNVILFEQEGSNGQQYHFRISMESTLSFRYLDEHQKSVLKDLYTNYFFRRQDNYWEKEAMQKLPELKRSTNMLICGEDLGMVPDCVSGVMKNLAILSLEIQRMPKDSTRQFFHPNDAPYLSVVTPSTHDMSTIRGWWEEDRGVTQRFFNNELGQWGTAPYFCEPWISKIILTQHFYSPAMWSIFQLQDLMGVSQTLRRENPDEERINIPSNPKHYWQYRMHISLEDLMEASEFNNEIKGYVVQSGR